MSDVAHLGIRSMTWVAPGTVRNVKWYRHFPMDTLVRDNLKPLHTERIRGTRSIPQEANVCPGFWAYPGQHWLGDSCGIAT